MCTRVLDISIAWIEPVPGHIVGERVYRFGPGANTIHCVGRAPTHRSVIAGVTIPRLGGKLGKAKNNSRCHSDIQEFVINFRINYPVNYSIKKDTEI